MSSLFEKKNNSFPNMKLDKKSIDKILSLHPDMFFLFDIINLKVVYSNRELFEYLGYSYNDDFIKDNYNWWVNVAHHDDIPLMFNTINESKKLNDDVINKTNIRLKNKQNEWLLFEFTYRVFQRDKKGNVTLLLGTTIDITEKINNDERISKLLIEVKERNQELESLKAELEQKNRQIIDEKEKLLAMINSTREIFFTIDLNYNITNFNLPFYERMKTLGVDLVEGMCIFNLMEPERVEHYKEVYKKIIQGETHSEVNFHNLKNGMQFYLNESFYPIRDTSGNVIGISVFTKDVTDIKKIEEQATRDRANLLSIIENTKDSILMVNEKKELIKFNSFFKNEFETSFNIEAKEGMKIIDELEKKFPDIANNWNKLYERALKGEFFLFEDNFEKDNEIKYYEVSFNPVYSDNKIIGVSVFSRNINDRKQKELELILNQQNLSSIIENTESSIWLLNKNYEVMVFNTAFKSSLKQVFDIDLISGMNIIEELTLKGEKEASDIWKSWYDKTFRAEIFSIESAFNISGNIQYFEVFFNPVYVNNNIEGVAVFAHNISERKIAENKVKESEAFLKAIINSTDDLVVSIDKNYKVISCNKPFVKIISGIGFEKFEGLDIFSVIPQENHDKVKKIYQKCFQGQKITETDRYRLSNKSLKALETTYNPIFNDNNEVVALSIFSKDRTEKFKYEEEIKESKRKIEEAQKIAKIGAWKLNMDTLDFELDKQHLRLVDPTSEIETKITSFKNFFENYVYSNDKKLISEKFEEAMINIENPYYTDSFEFRFVRKDKSIRYFSVIIQNYPDTKNEIFGVTQDITERKLLEQQLLHAQRIESIGTLAGGMAHEINNTLTPMLISLDRLNISDEKSRNLLEMIKVSAKRGAEIVKQVLIFSKLEIEEITTFKVKTLINEVKNVIKQSFPKSISLKIKIDDSSDYIKGNITLLNQALLNICINAKDAMSNSGTLFIQVNKIFINSSTDSVIRNLSETFHSGNYFEILISDDGTGIPENIHDKIFDPFFTTKDIGKGTGLGLSMTLSIIKNHKGYLDFQSNKEKGTTFKIYLPVVETSPEVSVLEKKYLNKNKNNKSEKNKILVVDDEIIILYSIKDYLESEGYIVITAKNGKDALKIYKDKKDEIDLILMDINMPVMDGNSLIEEILKINKNVKIIINSGLPVKNYESNKNFSSILKPYTQDELLEVVSNMLKS